MFVLTDGDDGYGNYIYDECIDIANEEQIKIYTVGLGSPNEDKLKYIAEASGGKYYYATSITDLEDCYEDIEEEVAADVTDSNGDGISDYYTEKICNGELTTSTGYNPFSGMTYETIQKNADWDGDGLPDLMVNTIVGDVVWFRNIGTRTKPELSPAADVEVEWEGVQPSLAYGWYRPHHKANPKGLLTQWRTTPVMFDWNCDGLVDLVMLDHEGYLALFERRRKDGKLLLLPPRRVFADRDGRPLRLSQRPAGRSGRRKLALADMNGDGQVDLLADGVNVDIYINLGVRNGVTCFADPMMAGARQLARHSTAPTTVDFNGDGRLELLAGAEDGYFYYLEIANK